MILRIIFLMRQFAFSVMSLALIFFSHLATAAPAHHFSISPIAYPQIASTPIPLTVTAKDAQDALTNFSGDASLWELGVPMPASVNPSASECVFPTIGGFSSIYSGRTQMIARISNQFEGPQLVSGLSFFFKAAPKAISNFTIRVKPTTLTKFASAVWDNDGWTTVFSGALNITNIGWSELPFSTPYLQNDQNLMVDLTFQSNFPLDTLGRVSAIGAASQLLGVYGVSTVPGQDPKQWTGSPSITNYVGVEVPDVRLTTRKLNPAAPSTFLSFASGVSSGSSVSVSQSGNSKAFLVLDQASGALGLSNDISVIASTSLSLSFGSGTISEEGSAITATLSRIGPMADALTVSLANANPGDASIPGQLTIPPGNSSATFTLTPIDDSLPEGAETLRVTATAPDCNSAIGSLIMTDNETATLAIQLPASVIEGGAGTGSITVASPLGANVTILLAVNDPTECMLPGIVILPMGQTSVEFPITTFDDGMLDGQKLVTISAQSSGLVGATGVLQILDATPQTSSLQYLGGSSSETYGTGIRTYLRLPAVTSVDRVFQLVSSDTTEANVPSVVTIAAGTSSTQFLTYGVDDDLTDGDQSVTITATTPGLSPATLTLTVRDDEIHHYEISSNLTSKLVNETFYPRVDQKTIDGYSIGNGADVPFTLTASSGGSPVTMTPVSGTALSYGSWSGEVRITQAASAVVLTATFPNGTKISTNSFDVSMGPMDHFNFATITGPKTANTPFSVTVTARDRMNNLVQDFNGSLVFSASALNTDTVTGNSVFAAANPLQTSFHDCRSQSIYTPAEVGGARLLTGLALGVARPPGVIMNNFTIRLKHTDLMDYTFSADWQNEGWTTVFRQNQSGTSSFWEELNLQAPFFFDGLHNLMVDISYDNAASAVDGQAYQTQASSARTIYFATNSLFGDPLSWSGETSPIPVTTTSLPYLKFSSDRAVGVNQGIVGPFSNGTWTGSVSVAEAGTNVVLLASAGGKTGQSATFNVINPAGRLGLTLPASEAEEGGPPLVASLTRNGPLSSDLPVLLKSSNASEATVPLTVTIPAGSASVTFLVTIMDDVVSDGAKTTLLTAAAEGFAMASQALTVKDNEISSISVTLPASMVEGAVAQIGTVAVGATAAFPRIVTLTPSAPSALVVPGIVTLPADESSVSFPVTLPNNTLVTFATSVQVTASLPGLGDASGSTIVYDDEAATAVTMAESTTEGTPINGTVTLSVAPSFATTVVISSSDPARTGAPATVVVAAGATSATFSIAPPDNPAKDGRQTVNITFQAAGYAPKMQPLVIYDNEFDHYGFVAPVPPGVPVNGLVPVAIAAQDISDETIPTFTGTINLTAFNGGGTVPMTSSPATFTLGVASTSVQFSQLATGVTILAADALARTASSTVFDVQPSGTMTRLEWGPIPAANEVNVPIPVTLTARDAGNNIATSYAGPVLLKAWVGGSDVAVGTGTVASSIFPLAAAQLSRTETMLLASQLGAAKLLTNLQLNVLTASASIFNNFTVRIRYTTKTSFSATAAQWDTTGWVTVYSGSKSFTTTGWNVIPFVTPFEYNGTGNLIVETSYSNTSAPTAVVIQSTTGTSNRTLYRSTNDTTLGSPLNWLASPAPVASLTQMNLRMGARFVRAITPVTATFVNGVWGGTLSLQDQGTNMVFVATDPGNSSTATSGTFNVTTKGSLGIYAIAPQSEGAGTVAGLGTVGVLNNPSSNVSVYLTSSDPSVATVPSSITMLAGTNTIAFPITMVNDSVLDGDQTTTIQASSPGYGSNSITLTVLDDDGTTLTLTAPSEVIEGQAAVTCTLTANVASSIPRTITLSSSNTSQLTVPASLSLAAGQTSATFSMTIVNDTLIDGDLPVVVTASSAGWVTGIANVLVRDNERKALALDYFTGTPVEGGSTTINISLPSGFVGPVTVDLFNNDPASVQMPAQVTIPSGQTSAQIAISLPENTARDGAHRVFIWGNAGGFLGASTTLSVQDNDLDYFKFDTIYPSDGVVGGVAFPITIRAFTHDGTALSVNIPGLALAARANGQQVPVTPATVGPMTAGVWTGNVTVSTVALAVVLSVTDGNGHSGSSTPFNAIVGRMDKFLWSTVPNPQKLNVPFTATVKAVDVAGNVVSTYYGKPALSVISASSIIPSGTGSLSLGEYIGGYFKIAGRNQGIYLPSEVGPARTLAAMSVKVVSLPSKAIEGVTIRLKHTSKMNYDTGSPKWENSDWTTVYQGTQDITKVGWNEIPFSTPFVYDGTSNLMVDFSYYGSGTANGAYIEGSLATPDKRSIYYSTSSPGLSPLFWSGASPSPNSGGSLANLKFSSAPLPVTPSVLSLVNGVWTGEVNVGEAGEAIVLHTQDVVSGGTYPSAFVTGDSNTFSVDYFGTLGLTLPSTAREGNLPLTGVVTLDPPQASNFVISLASSDPTAAMVPASIIIPAGHNSALFPITIHNDTAVNGPKPTVITASKSLYKSSTATLLVLDDDAVNFSVTLPVSVNEGAGLLYSAGTVNLGVPTTSLLTVHLSSSAPELLSVPETISILPDFSSNGFNITVMENLLRNPQKVTITAHVDGWPDALATTVISDNESTADWPMLGNGPSHTGYQPVSLGTSPFTAGWTKSYAFNGWSWSGTQASISQNKVFITRIAGINATSTYAAAIDKVTGVETWRHAFVAASILSPPVFSAGKLFIQRFNSYTDSQLWCLNAGSGGTIWSSSFLYQSSGNPSPTVYGDGAWMEAAGTYGFNVGDGSERFSFSQLGMGSSGASDNWTPTYDSGVIYTWNSKEIQANDAVTGDSLWSLALPIATVSNQYGSVCAIDGGRAYVVNELGICCVDLANRASVWTAPGSFVRSPAVAKGVVYGIVGGSVRAYNASNGTLLGAYATGATSLTAQPIITNDTLIVCSSTASYVFNLATRVLRQTIPVGGGASLAGAVLYVAGTDGVLRTYAPPISTDANLSSLSSSGALAPAFSPGILNYTISVGNTTSAVQFTPVAASSTSTISVDSETVTSGTSSSPITLIPGTNLVNITVTAQDGSTSKTYQVAVIRNTLYQDWTIAKNLPPNERAAAQDPDNDGKSNLLEWAFGNNPNVGAVPGLIYSGGVVTSHGEPRVIMDDSSSPPRAYAVFGRRLDASAAGLDYNVEFSGTLNDWQTINGIIPTILAADDEIQAVAVPFPAMVNGHPAKFFRVKVTAH